MPRDVDHRRRVDATVGNRRIQLRLKFDTCEIVRTIVNPNVVVFVNGQARDATHLPLAGQGLGPAHIDFEFRRGFRLRSQPAMENAGRKENRTNS